MNVISLCNLMDHISFSFMCVCVFFFFTTKSNLLLKLKLRWSRKTHYKMTSFPIIERDADYKKQVNFNVVRPHRRYLTRIILLRKGRWGANFSRHNFSFVNFSYHKLSWYGSKETKLDSNGDHVCLWLGNQGLMLCLFDFHSSTYKSNDIDLKK